MISFMKRHLPILRTVAAVMVIMTVILTVSPAFVPPAAADDPVYTPKYIYKWSRFYQHFDVPEEGKVVPCMLIWPSSGTYYATLGKNIGSNNRGFYGVDITNNETLKFKPDWKKEKNGNAPPANFYTEGTMDSWTCIGAGADDGDTWYFDKLKFRLCDGKTYAYDDSNHLGFSTNSSTAWTIVGVGANDGDNYANNATYGYASIIYTRGGMDRYFDDDGSRLTVNEYTWLIGGFDYDAPDFLLYYGYSKEEYSGLGNYTVKSGTTFQIKNNTWLNKNCTVTVEPGAVLSIDGRFINDGMIENYGTVIVNDGASVYYFGERSSTGGSITNYGSGSTYYGSSSKGVPGEGNFIIMPNARVILPYTSSTGGVSYATVKLTKGATLVNFGLLSVPRAMEISDALIQNKASGVICSHYGINDGEYKVKDFTWAKKGNYSLSHLSGVYNDFRGTKTVIENDGLWQNYSENANAGAVVYSGSGSVT